MAGGWVTDLIEGLKRRTVFSNIAFSFILIVLDQVTKMQFECPCMIQELNLLVSCLFCFVPAGLSFFLILIIKDFQKQGCRGTFFDVCSTLSSAAIPPSVWTLLVLFDGRYFACAFTNWPGRYVIIDKATPLRYCQPDDDIGKEELMKESQLLYLRSQLFGIFPLLFICGVSALYILQKLLCCCFKKKKDDLKDNTLRRTDMKQISIDMEDCYEFLWHMSEKNMRQTTSEEDPPSATLWSSNRPPPEEIPYCPNEMKQININLDDIYEFISNKTGNKSTDTTESSNDQGCCLFSCCPTRTSVDGFGRGRLLS